MSRDRNVFRAQLTSALNHATSDGELIAVVRCLLAMRDAKHGTPKRKAKQERELEAPQAVLRG